MDLDVNVNVDNAPKNWCHMPAEIKILCIKTMSLMLRFAIWCTSKTERELVNSQRRLLEQVTIINGRLKVYGENGALEINISLEEPEDIEKNNLLLTCILTTCSIKNFYLQTRFLNLPKQLHELVGNESIRIICLHSEMTSLFDHGWLQFILKKSWKFVTHIILRFGVHVVAMDIDTMFKMPSINHAGSITIHRIAAFHRCGGTYAHMYIKKLIEHDAKINTMYYTEYSYEHHKRGIRKKANELRNRFRDREVSFINSNMLMRTDNPEKEIVIRFHHSQVGYIKVSATVVPANLPVEQYPLYLNVST